MAKTKFYMTIPGCSSCGCPYYVNNCKEDTYVKRAHGRTLYWGERYCLHGKRAKQFLKSIGTLPSWCPRRIRYPIIRIFTGYTKSKFEEQFGAGVYIPKPERYHLCRVTNTTLTPLQFSKKIQNRNTDLYELLGWNPHQYDVIQIDVGLTQFYIWLSDGGWTQTSFDWEKADRGVVGDFIFIPHQHLDPDRYQYESATYSEQCIGYISGYFAGGVFRCQWTENQPIYSADSAACQKELEDLLFTLQKEGFLQSMDDLQDYCYTHYWSRLDDNMISFNESHYGFSVTRQDFSYYMRLVPSEDSLYNIQIFCYPVHHG